MSWTRWPKILSEKNLSQNIRELYVVFDNDFSPLEAPATVFNSQIDSVSAARTKQRHSLLA